MKDYLVSAEKQFRQYKSLGERALAQISAEDVHWQYNEESKSQPSSHVSISCS